MKKLERFLSEQDLACDVKAVYAELREELPVSKAVAELKREFAEARQDEDDAPLFWLGLASAMAESKELTKAVEEKALAYFYNNAFAARYGEISGFTPCDIEAIKAYFASSVGKAKRKPGSTSPYKAVTTWKPSEVYAYLLQSENAQEYGVAGRYLLFHVQDTGEWDNEIMPIFHVYITIDDKLPQNSAELGKCIRIPCAPRNNPPIYRYIFSWKYGKRSVNFEKLVFVGDFTAVPAINEKFFERIMYYKYINLDNIEWLMEWARTLNLI